MKKEQSEIKTAILEKEVQEVQLSSVKGSVLQEIIRTFGVRLVSAELPPTGGRNPLPAPFKWIDGIAEPNQEEAYMKYLTGHLQLPRDVSMISVRNIPQLFAQRLGPYHFTGTSDLVIAPRTAVKQDNIMLLSQLLVVIELKKPAGFQQGASQAYVELLCANVGRGFSPIVVLTDLGEQWAVMWVGADPDEPAQFAFYRADCSFAEAAHAVQVVCGQIVIDQGVTRQKRQAGEAPDYPLLQRKHFKPSTATVDAGDDERLYDVLSPEERHRVQLLEEAQVFYKRFREDYPMEFPKVGLSMFS